MGLFSGIGKVLKGVTSVGLGAAGGFLGSNFQPGSFLNAWGPTIAGGLNSAGDYMSARDANQETSARAIRAQNFSRESQILGQQFGAYETEKSRNFQDQQALRAMNFSGARADIGMRFAGDRADKSMAFSADQAKIQRDFQERMSSSAYQRAMDDMRKSGLNPILAYRQGGAGSPSGAMGQGAAPGGQGAAGSAGGGANAPGGAAAGVALPAIEEFRGALSSAAAVRQVGAQTRQINAQKKVANVQEFIGYEELKKKQFETASARAGAKIAEDNQTQTGMYAKWLRSNVGSKMFQWDKFWQAFNPFTTSAKALR